MTAQWAGTALPPERSAAKGEGHMRNWNGNVSLVLPVVLVGLVMWQQLRTRPVRRIGSLIAPAVLSVVGVVGIVFGVFTVVHERPLTVLSVALLVASLAVAAVFGVARAKTVRVWRGPQGEVLRKGTAATTGLWLASVGVHIGLGLWIDHAAGAGVLGTVSLYAYLAIGLGTQNLFVRVRTAALSDRNSAHAEQAALSAPQAPQH